VGNNLLTAQYYLRLQVNEFGHQLRVFTHIYIDVNK